LEDETASDFVYSLGRFGSNLIAGIDIEVGSWVVSSWNVHCGLSTFYMAIFIGGSSVVCCWE